MVATGVVIVVVVEWRFRYWRWSLLCHGHTYIFDLAGYVGRATST